MMQVFLAEVDYLLCGAPSRSETSSLFCNDLFGLWLECLSMMNFNMIADKADGSVVLTQLQVAFLWKCDN